MIDIPVQVLELLKLDSIKKNFRIHFPNGEADDIVNDDCIAEYDENGNLIVGATEERNHLISESVSFTESLCSQDTLKFGLCEANVLEFECHLKEPVKGAICQATLEVDATTLQGMQSKYQTIDYVCCEANKRVVYTKNRYDLKKYENFIFKSNDTPITYVWARLADSFGMFGDWYCAYSYDNTVKLGDGLSAMPVDKYIAPSVKQFCIEHNRRKDENKGEGAVEIEYYRTDYVEDARYIEFCLQFSLENGACWVNNSKVAGIETRSDTDYPVYPIPYGLYTVESDDRKSENLILRKMECYSPLITDKNTVTGDYFGTWTGLSPIERAKMHYPVTKSDYNIDLVKFIYSNVPFMGTQGIGFTKLKMEDDEYRLGTFYQYNGSCQCYVRIFRKIYRFKTEAEAKELYGVKYDKTNSLLSKLLETEKTVIAKYGSPSGGGVYAHYKTQLDESAYASFQMQNPYYKTDFITTIKLSHNENFVYPWISQKKSSIKQTYAKGYIFVALPYRADIVMRYNGGGSEVFTTYGKYKDPYIAKANMSSFSTMDISFERRQDHKKSKYYICTVADEMAKAHRTKIVAGATATVTLEAEDNTDLLKKSSENGSEFSWHDMVEAFLEINGMFCMWDRWNECYKFFKLDRGNFVYPTDYEDITKNRYPKKSGLYPHGDAWGGQSSYANIHQTYYKSTNDGALFPDDDLYPSDSLYPNDGVEHDIKSNGYYKTTWWSDTKSRPYRAVVCSYTLVKSVNKSNVNNSITEDVYLEYTIPKAYDIEGNAIEYELTDRTMTYDISDNWIVKNIPILDEAVIEKWLQNLARSLEDISFYSTDTDMLGLPYVEAGDWVRIFADSYDGTLYASPILRRTLTGIQALTDQVTSSNEES